MYCQNRIYNSLFLKKYLQNVIKIIILKHLMIFSYYIIVYNIFIKLVA